MQPPPPTLYPYLNLGKNYFVDGSGISCPLTWDHCLSQGKGGGQTKPARQMVFSIDGKVWDTALGWVLKCPCLRERGLVPANLPGGHICRDKGASVELETLPVRVCSLPCPHHSLPAEVSVDYRTQREPWMNLGFWLSPGILSFVGRWGPNLYSSL